MDHDEFGSGVWGGDDSSLPPLPLTSSIALTTSAPPLDIDAANDEYEPQNTETNYKNYSSNPLNLDALSLGHAPFATASIAFEDPFDARSHFAPVEQSYAQPSYSSDSQGDAWGSPFASSSNPYASQSHMPLKGGIAVTTTITPTPVLFDPLANVQRDKDEDEEHAQREADEADNEHLYEFQVSISEPQKIGNELMGGYTVYKVSTWTNCPGYKHSSFSVSRRYSDFLWLYNQLVERYPGAIIQPLPGKQNLGRFAEDFVESRRAGLEKFLRKTVSHSLFQQDADLRLFLESSTFATDQKEVKPTSSFISIPGLTAAASAFAAGANSGRILDNAELDKRRHQMDFVDERHLKVLQKALESLVKQRRDYANASFEFGESLNALAAVEGGKPIGRSLAVVGEIHKRIKELHDKQASMDITNMAATVEEHLRLIGAIRVAFAGRMKAFTVWQNADLAVKKKKEGIERMRADPKARADQIVGGLNNLPELEGQARFAWDELKKVTDLVNKEMERYDKERIADFTGSVQAVLKSFVENQKEIIRLWESYYELTGQEPPCGEKQE
ncbi:Vacuolar protein sorting-associated protein 5 [Rhizoclosmatium hyalinum]|nr:Vacuolar protein sorting-associated protein 5 [Rhizoclosmatium hyalinum]